MEIAKMFGGWPIDLLAMPVAEYARLREYYFAVKDVESQDNDEPDDADEEDE
jgi:hypothetical protein